MKYLFKKVSLKGNDKYAINSGVFRQTSMWRKLKKLFRTVCINGYDNNGNIVLSCMIFKFGFIFHIAYAPRGFICDYDNLELIEEFTYFYKEYMRINRIFYTIFDPELIKRSNFEESSKDKNIHDKLLNLGYKNKGKLINQMQINNNYRVKITKDVSTQFDKKLIYDIKLCQKRGVTIEKYTGKEMLGKPFDTFMQILNETKDRKHFELRPTSFYINLAKYLDSHCTIYLAKYNYDIDYNNTINLIEETNKEIELLISKENKRNDNKIKELKENINSYNSRLKTILPYKNKTIYIGGSYYISLGKQSHYLLGANSSELRFTKPTTLLVNEMIMDSIKNGNEYFNLGGSLLYTTDKIENDPMYSVYAFKKQLNGEFVDYYGDYFLISNEKMYNFLEEKHRLMRRLNCKL